MLLFAAAENTVLHFFIKGESRVQLLPSCKASLAFLATTGLDRGALHKGWGKILSRLWDQPQAKVGLALFHAK